MSKFEVGKKYHFDFNEDGELVQVLEPSEEGPTWKVTKIEEGVLTLGPVDDE